MADYPEIPKPTTKSRQGFLNIVPVDDRPFLLKPIGFPDPRLIPPRQWIYGRQLIRGFVTLLVAPGGTGKSSLILATLIAIATNRPFLGERIYQQCNTALLNLEDPQEELDRRLAAIAMRYGLTNEMLEGKFWMSDADRAVTIARTDDDGFGVVHPDETQIIERVRDEKIGVIGVDPFAECHNLEENSNPQMIQAAAAWRRVARSGNCSVLLSHHVRKGIVDGIEAARGAKALTDSARVGLLLSTMTEDDASTLGVPADDRRRYVRMDDAKANLSARSPKASWFHLDHLDLGNGTPDYPAGDQVVVITDWTPPNLFADLSNEDCNRALDGIEAGMPPDGTLYSANRKAGDRWAGNVLMATLGIPDGRAGEVIKAWLKTGLLTKVRFHDSAQRKERDGLAVNSTLRPGTSMA